MNITLIKPIATGATCCVWDATYNNKEAIVKFTDEEQKYYLNEVDVLSAAADRGVSCVATVYDTASRGELTHGGYDLPNHLKHEAERIAASVKYPYMVMKKYPYDMRQVLKLTNSNYDIRNTKMHWQLCAQLFDMVADIHSRGIIHTDIKPGNILLEAIDGRAEIPIFGAGGGAYKMLFCDFGTAVVDDKVGSPYIGSFRYMPPELTEVPAAWNATHKQLITSAVDIWEAMVTCWEFFTCNLLFDIYDEDCVVYDEHVSPVDLSRQSTDNISTESCDSNDSFLDEEDSAALKDLIDFIIGDTEEETKQNLLNHIARNYEFEEGEPELIAEFFAFGLQKNPANRPPAAAIRAWIREKLNI